MLCTIPHSFRSASLYRKSLSVKKPQDKQRVPDQLLPVNKRAVWTRTNRTSVGVREVQKEKPQTWLVVKPVLEVCTCVCWCFTLQLGGHRKRGRTLARAVSVGRDHPKRVLGVGDEVLNGDLHLSRSAGVLHTLPVSKTTVI